jgi:hypothetical protein
VKINTPAAMSHGESPISQKPSKRPAAPGRRTPARLEPDYPGLGALFDTVSARPNIADYLSSKRRLPFSVEGLFRRYAQLDR